MNREIWKVLLTVIFVLSIVFCLMNITAFWVMVGLISTIAFVTMYFNRKMGMKILLCLLIPCCIYLTAKASSVLIAKAHASRGVGKETGTVSKASSDKPDAGKLPEPPPPSKDNGGGKKEEDGDMHDDSPPTPPDTSGAPKADAPARPKEKTAETVPDVPPASPVVIATPLCHYAQPSRVGPVEIQSGDYFITLLHCDKKGSQIQFSGTVEYDGTGTGFAAFGELIITGSPFGKQYILGKAFFGDSNSFGRGYSSQSLDPHSPKQFYAEVSDVDDNPVTASFSTTVRVGGSERIPVTFYGLALQ